MAPKTELPKTLWVQTLGPLDWHTIYKKFPNVGSSEFGTDIGNLTMFPTAITMAGCPRRTAGSYQVR